MRKVLLKRVRGRTRSGLRAVRALWLSAAVSMLAISVGLSAQEVPNNAPPVVVRRAAPTIKAPEDVATPPVEAISTPSGLRMKLLHSGAGMEAPASNDFVLVRFAAWRRDGTLQSTSGLNGQTAIQGLPRTVVGVAEALKLMVEGEKRRVWIPANLTYLPTRHGPLGKVDEDEPPPGVDLTFDLELVQIMKVPATPGDLKHPPSTATMTPSGVALQVLTRGEGTTHPSASSRVSLHYSAWTAEGKLFETTVTTGHPGTFVMGNLLPGWREGVESMVVGEKTRLWIPAALAYGEKPPSRKVPAGNLVLDVQLLGIE